MSRTTAYAYDLSGNIVQKTLANSLRELRTHDGRNRVSTLDNRTAAGSGYTADIAGYAYQYDRTGNVMQVVEDYPSGDLAGRTITNSYDGVYRLLAEVIATTPGSTVTTSYAYDNGHNRTSKAVSGGSSISYVIGNGGNGAGANQIISTTSGGVTTYYGYDRNGNRSSRVVAVSPVVVTGTTTQGSPVITGLSSTSGLTLGMTVNGAGIPSGAIVMGLGSGTATISVAATLSGTGVSLTFSPTPDTYQYDYENRLTGFEDYDGAGGYGSILYSYAYDYRTRRVTRTEGSTKTNIVFDGGTSIEEYTGTPGSPTVEYVRGHDYGGGVGGLEYSVRSSVAHFNFFDSRGDVTTQTNSSGAITYQTAYEAFGNQTVNAGFTSDRQKASTKEQDPTGLLNEGFRYRDPATGTFLTRDPMGFKAGPNMYTYVRQNPWTHFDPEGLDVNMNLYPPGSDIYNNAKNIPAGNDYTVGAHGNPQLIQGPTGGNYSIPTLALQIKNDPNYKSGETIDLISCSTGVGKNPPAQQLANAMGAGTTVKAPTDTIWIYPDGHTVVAPAKGGDTKNGPDLSHQGDMKSFTPQATNTQPNTPLQKPTGPELTGGRAGANGQQQAEYTMPDGSKVYVPWGSPPPGQSQSKSQTQATPPSQPQSKSPPPSQSITQSQSPTQSPRTQPPPPPPPKSSS
jgi:RHS repeat-associated protein